MTVIRAAEAEDAEFLERMLAIAADWREAAPRPVSAVMAEPHLAHYVAGWPRPGDVGFVAEADGVPVGGAWWRFLPADDPGYGFVDETTPEVSIAVEAFARGRGVGRLLMDALVARAREEHLPALSLSVEQDNRARDLYLAIGFVPVAQVGGSDTMVLSLR